MFGGRLLVVPSRVFKAEWRLGGVDAEGEKRGAFDALPACCTG